MEPASLREITRVLRVQVGQSLARGLREESERAMAVRRRRRRRRRRLARRRRAAAAEEEEEEEELSDLSDLSENKDLDLDLDSEEEEEGTEEDDVAPLAADAKLLNDLTKLVLQYSSVFAADLIAFAKHAKRKTLKPEDVLLCARRSAALRERLEGAAAARTAAGAGGGRKKKASKKAAAAAEVGAADSGGERSGSSSMGSSDGEGSSSSSSSAAVGRKGGAGRNGMHGRFRSAGKPIVLDGDSSSDRDDGLLNLGDDEEAFRSKPSHDKRKKKKRKQPHPQSSKKSKKKGRVRRTVVHSDDSDFD